MKLNENNKFLNENIRKLMKSNTKTNGKKRLTRKEKEELVKKLYEQGYTYREIAKKLRISVRDISRILKSEERKDEIDEIKERLSKLDEMIKKIDSDIDTIFNIIGPIIRGLNSAVTREWTCPNCGEKGFVAIYVKCGACGYKTWWGWWK